MRIEIWDDTPQQGEARNEFRPNQSPVRFILNCLDNLSPAIARTNLAIARMRRAAMEAEKAGREFARMVLEIEQRNRVDKLFTRLAHLIIAVNTVAILSGILTAIMR